MEECDRQDAAHREVGQHAAREPRPPADAAALPARQVPHGRPQQEVAPPVASPKQGHQSEGSWRESAGLRKLLGLGRRSQEAAGASEGCEKARRAPG
eukprot:3195163-Prymnesium_polylepis.1